MLSTSFWTLRTTAMEAGLAVHVWTSEEVAMLVEAHTPKAGKRGPYKKSARAITDRPDESPQFDSS